MFGKSKLNHMMFALVLLGIVGSSAVVIYAISPLWQAPASVNVKIKETKTLAVYSDSSTINTISGVSFGDLEQGAQVTKVLYIKNTGNVAVTLDWASDLKSSSNNYLGDDWLFQNSQASWQSIRGYSLPAGAVLETQYKLFIAGTAPAKSYSWVLQLGY